MVPCGQERLGVGLLQVCNPSGQFTAPAPTTDPTPVSSSTSYCSPNVSSATADLCRPGAVSGSLVSCVSACLSAILVMWPGLTGEYLDHHDHSTNIHIIVKHEITVAYLYNCAIAHNPTIAHLHSILRLRNSCNESKVCISALNIMPKYQGNDTLDS